MQLRLTVWSLVTKKPIYIQYPKFTDKGHAFRKDGRYFAIAERLNGKDHVGIYDTLDWSMLKVWPLKLVFILISRLMGVKKYRDGQWMRLTWRVSNGLLMGASLRFGMHVSITKCSFTILMDGLSQPILRMTLDSASSPRHGHLRASSWPLEATTKRFVFALMKDI